MRPDAASHSCPSQHPAEYRLQKALRRFDALTQCLHQLWRNATGRIWFPLPDSTCPARGWLFIARSLWSCVRVHRCWQSLVLHRRWTVQERQNAPSSVRPLAWGDCEGTAGVWLWPCVRDCEGTADQALPGSDAAAGAAPPQGTASRRGQRGDVHLDVWSCAMTGAQDLDKCNPNRVE